ncbi:hypothetical protein HU200_001255 [Digitaria exilis]|uniref:Wall-associated receptor kinase galacturonan-binding domain-containing protein n=1 Tax=Digitaria exilis TaxID=1010633 RepID=A0A835FYN8_9POAL|nr:hypothetical protein HU200_001255 [Digitaria exilis]
MDVLDALLIVLLLQSACADTGVLAASQGVPSYSVPSAASLAGCPKSDGDKTFDYPFGIGAGCFRSPGFELICNQTTKGLYLSDGDTAILNDITPRRLHTTVAWSSLQQPLRQTVKLSVTGGQTPYDSLAREQRTRTRET